jgi:hypothetical protein
MGAVATRISDCFVIVDDSGVASVADYIDERLIRAL